MVNPSTWDFGAVQSSDGSLGEQSGQQTSDHTTDTVSGEDIEGVVNAQEELDSSRQVADGGGDETNGNGCRGADVTGRGSDSD